MRFAHRCSKGWPPSEVCNVPTLGSMRPVKMATGVKMGMSTGMIAHHSWGLAISKLAATSIAATKHMRIAILIAQERVDRSCIGFILATPDCI
jgi:hypothetical protein